MKNKNLLVLAVEDDEFLVEIHKNKLTKAGFDVVLGKNGVEAIEMAKKNKPDIILLDLIMPMKDGFETLRELKEDPELKDIKVIALTNLSQEEDKKRIMDLGAVEYIVKANVSFSEIISIIKKHGNVE